MMPLRPLFAAALLVLVAPAAAGQTRSRATASTPRPAVQLISGPMLGYVTQRDAMLWAQTDGPARVQVRYRAEGTAGAWTVTPAVETTADGSYAAHLPVSGLEPGVRYAYDLVVNGRAMPRPYATVIATQPLWQWRTDPPTVTVAIGSCAYINEAAYDRPGTPYGSDYAIFQTIARMRPDAMVWMGDNIYTREVDWWTPEGIDRRYQHARSLPDLQPLLAATAHYAIWDDHDYGPNDADRSYVQKGAALGLFKRYWANLSYGLPETPGVFGQFQVGDAEFFLTDDRYHRAPDGYPTNDPEKAFFGDAQFQWLIDALTTSKAPFKFVVVGGQVVNPVAIYETMATYARERQRLFDEIARRRIPGVVFLSGDRHMTELQRLDRDGAYPLYDFTSSSLTAGTSRPAPQEVDSPTRVPGTLVTAHNFGTLTLTGPRTDRTLTMRTYGVDGTMLWERSIRAADLAYPRN
ncbi:MAG: alkaline phosphatase family protein [Bacteroidetes bacterium]|nr:alkaline phosphatase family protein [Bacteroidota bacterium]